MINRKLNAQQIEELELLNEFRYETLTLLENFEALIDLSNAEVLKEMTCTLVDVQEKVADIRTHIEATSFLIAMSSGYAYEGTLAHRGDYSQ